MRVIIAGSRTFNDYNLLQTSCDNILESIINIEIVSGTCNGADQLGERYSNEKGYKLKQFPADWDRYGKSAGYKRNEQMAKYADMLIVFWDGKSKGTKNMINIAENLGIEIKVIKY